MTDDKQKLAVLRDGFASQRSALEHQLEGEACHCFHQHSPGPMNIFLVSALRKEGTGHQLQHSQLDRNISGFDRLIHIGPHDTNFYPLSGSQKQTERVA
jgi:hypothetical protein